MFTINVFTLIIFMTSLVSAYPLAILSHSPASPLTPDPPGSSGSQTSLKDSSNSTTGFHTLQSLYDGNQKFRQGARVLAEVEADEGGP